ncbi:MAG: TlpA family protein disulfide reductase [Candidatus Kapabacteria bacterium]|nr:TlpA family protein disulfide reductase [Candidatus Kapabacteria bacterium]
MSLIISSILKAELRFEPARPAFGENVTIHYQDKDSIFSGIDTVYAMIYGFASQSNNPQGFSVPLALQGDSYIGNITLSGNWVYVIAFVEFDENLYDKNRQNYWELYITNNEGNIQRDAHLFSALALMGASSPNLNPIVNLDSAHKRMEREVELYPDNFPAQVGLLSLRYDMKKITLQGFKDKATQMLDEKKIFVTENEVKAAHRLLNAINRNKDGDALINNFVQTNPLSKLAEEDAMSKLSLASDMQNFVDMAALFIDRFPNSNDVNNVYSAVVSSYTQTGKSEELFKFIEARRLLIPEVFSKLAWDIFSNDAILPAIKGEQRLDMIDSLLDLSVKIVVGQNGLNKPTYMTEREWERAKNQKLASIYEIKADVNSKLDPVSAEGYYERALDLFGNDATVNLYENAINLADKQADSVRVLSLVYRAFANSLSSDFLVTQFGRYYRADNREMVLDSLQNVGRLKRYDKYKIEMLAQARPSTLFLTAYDGRLINLDDLNGKIFILSFWSTWCGPCHATIPALEEINAFYSEDDGVEVALVSIWEKTKDKKEALNTYFKRDFPNVPLVWDELDVIPMSLGITGLPVTYIFDSNGVCRFTITGFSSAKAFIDEVVDKTNFLIHLEGQNGQK